MIERTKFFEFRRMDAGSFWICVCIRADRSSSSNGNGNVVGFLTFHSISAKKPYTKTGNQEIFFLGGGGLHNRGLRV